MKLQKIVVCVFLFGVTCTASAFNPVFIKNGTNASIAIAPTSLAGCDSKSAFSISVNETLSAGQQVTLAKIGTQESGSCTIKFQAWGGPVEIPQSQAATITLNADHNENFTGALSSNPQITITSVSDKTATLFTPPCCNTVSLKNDTNVSIAIAPISLVGCDSRSAFTINPGAGGSMVLAPQGSAPLAKAGALIDGSNSTMCTIQFQIWGGPAGVSNNQAAIVTLTTAYNASVMSVNTTNSKVTTISTLGSTVTLSPASIATCSNSNNWLNQSTPFQCKTGNDTNLFCKNHQLHSSGGYPGRGYLGMSPTLSETYGLKKENALCKSKKQASPQNCASCYTNYYISQYPDD